MKREKKKSIVSIVIISFFTSAYAAFLNTMMNQGLLSDRFLVNWINAIPRTYLFILPFAMITGPLIKSGVDRLFRNLGDADKKNTG